MKYPPPKLNGVCRDAENDKALVLLFDRPLADHELRYVHDAYRMISEAWVDAEIAVASTPRTVQ